MINIIKNTSIRNKYQKGWYNNTRPMPPVEVVIHGTGGGLTSEGIITWMEGGERATDYLRGIGLFHYLIGKIGRSNPSTGITEIIDPFYYVYHSSSGSHAKYEIGIELVNASMTNREPYTKDQYNCLFDLIFEHLMKLYPIERITSHKYNIMVYNNKWTIPKIIKECPGNFDWSKLDAELTKRNIDFKTDGNLRYDLMHEES